MAEADALLAAAEDDDRATGLSLMAPLIALLVNGGLRISEALALRLGTAAASTSTRFRPG